MKAEALSGVLYNTLLAEVVNRRYTGKITIRFSLVCQEGGIRDCAAGIEKGIDTDMEDTRPEINKK